VKPRRVVIVNVLGRSLLGFFLRRWATWSNALLLQRTMPTLKLAIALRVIRARTNVREAIGSNEFLEVLRDELGPIITDDSDRENNPSTSCTSSTTAGNASDSVGGLNFVFTSGLFPLGSTRYQPMPSTKTALSPCRHHAAPASPS